METLKYKHIRVFCLALALILGGCATKKVSKVYDAPPPAIPSADGNLFERATRAQDQGQFEEAEKLWKRFMERHPNSYEAHNNLGEVYYLQDKLTQSLKEFDAAFRLEPVSDKIRKNYQRVLKFQLTLLNESKEYDRVMEGLQRLKEISQPGEKENIQFKIERIEDKIFEEVRRSDSASDYREFLNKYPDGVNGDAARRRLQELEGPSPQTSESAPLLDGAEPVPPTGGTLEDLAPYDEPSPILEENFIDDDGLGNKTEAPPSWSKFKPTQEARRSEPAPRYDGFFYNEPADTPDKVAQQRPNKLKTPRSQTVTNARVAKKAKSLPNTAKTDHLPKKAQPIPAASSTPKRLVLKTKPSVTAQQRRQPLEKPRSQAVNPVRVAKKPKLLTPVNKAPAKSVRRNKPSLIERTYAKDRISPPWDDPEESQRSERTLAQSEFSNNGPDEMKGNTNHWSQPEAKNPLPGNSNNNSRPDPAKPRHENRDTRDRTASREEAYPGMENEQFDEESFGSWSDDSPWGSSFENPEEARRSRPIQGQRRYSNRMRDEVNDRTARAQVPELSQNAKAARKTTSGSNPASPVEKADPVIQMVVVDIETGTLNVRAAPSTSGKVVGQLKDGEARPFLDEINKWYRIEFKTGLTGWVSRQFARKQEWRPSSQNLQGEKLSHLHFKEYHSKR